MALSAWDQQYLTKTQQDAILRYTQQWEDAYARGDQAGMAQAHAGAEKVRGMAGYSGGSEGTGRNMTKAGTQAVNTSMSKGYDNGSLTSDQVKRIQGALGVAQDGYFGPQTQAAAFQAWNTYGADAAQQALVNAGKQYNKAKTYVENYAEQVPQQPQKTSVVQEVNTGASDAYYGRTQGRGGLGGQNKATEAQRQSRLDEKIAAMEEAARAWDDASKQGGQASVDAYNRYQAARHALEMAGVDPDNPNGLPNFGERVGKTATGSAKLYGAQLAGIPEWMANVEQSYEQAKAASGYDDSRFKEGNNARVWQAPTQEDLNAQAKHFQGVSDKLLQSGSRDIERAQEGLGWAGRTAINAGVAATQMLGDLAIGAATGGGAMLPMVIRSFGGGVQEARQKGYNALQQTGLGLAGAATEWFTEKLFGGNPVYDKAGAGIVNKLVAKLTKNKKLIEALSSVPADIISEGLEEVISDLFEPLYNKIITGKATDLELDQIIDDFVVGAALGALGQGGQYVVNKALGNEAEANAQKVLQEVRSQQQAPATTLYLNLDGGNKMSLKKAQEVAGIAERVAAGEQVSDGDFKRLNLDNAQKREVFNQIAGTQLDESVNRLWDSPEGRMQVQQSIRAEVQANQQKAIAQNQQAVERQAAMEKQQQAVAQAQGAQQRALAAQQIVAQQQAAMQQAAESPNMPGEITYKNGQETSVTPVAGEQQAEPGEVSYNRDGSEKSVKPLTEADGTPMVETYKESNDAQSSGFPGVSVKTKRGELNFQQFADLYRKNAPNAERTTDAEIADRFLAQAKKQGTLDEESYNAYRATIEDGLNRAKAAESAKTETQRTGILSGARDSDIKLAERLGTLLGRRVLFYDGATVEGVRSIANGYNVEGSNDIYVNVRSGNPLAQIISHEMTHTLESTGNYGELKNLIKNWIGEDAWNARKDQVTKDYADSKVFLDDTHAENEAMARFIEHELLTDEDAIRRMVTENRTLGQKILDWLTDIYGKLTGDASVQEKTFIREAMEKYSRAIMESEEQTNQAVSGLRMDSPTGTSVIHNAAELVEQTYRQQGEILNESGDVVAENDSTGGTRFFLMTYDDKGREVLSSWLNEAVQRGDLTGEDAQDIKATMENLYEIAKKAKESGEYEPFSKWSDAMVVVDSKGNPVFSVVKANNEYVMNLDFSLVCKKRATLDAVLNELVRRGAINGLKLNEAGFARINKLIQSYGFETACDLCFVDAKRYRQAKVADTFVNLYNSMVRKIQTKNGHAVYNHFNFGGDETITHKDGGIESLNDDALKLDALEKYVRKHMPKSGGGTVDYRIAKYLLEHPEGRQLLDRGDFISTRGLDSVKENGPDILKLFNAKKGTGGPKAAESNVQYLNEILTDKNFDRDKAYAVGGVRIQSFSDYVPRMVFDYAQMIADLAAKQLPAHSYTKEELYALTFGLTGVKINMSLVPDIVEGGVAPGLDKDGNYAWRDGQSFGSVVGEKGSAERGFQRAVEIQSDEQYGKNCGTIAVGVSDEHIRAMMQDPRIRMIIPYHKSSLSPIVARMANIDSYVNYTDYQNTRIYDKETDKYRKLDPKKEKDKALLDKLSEVDYNTLLHQGVDPRDAAERYVRKCEELGLEPKFSQFAYKTFDGITAKENGQKAVDENYYKLLTDFSVYDEAGDFAPQGDVHVTFPNDTSAFGSVEDLILQGLSEDAVLEGKRDKKVSAIVDDIVNGIGPKTSDGKARETGVQYSIAGEQAIGANLTTLVKAKQLDRDGKTAEKIWNETKWWKGKDGKWRFEISDENLTLKDWLPNKRGKLEDFIEHDALFKAYPFLRGINVIRDLPGGGAKGKSDAGRAIHLQTEKFLSGEDLRSTIAHEVQHQIQRYEDFAGGANLDKSYMSLFLEKANNMDEKTARHFLRIPTYDARVRFIERLMAADSKDARFADKHSGRLYDALYEYYQSAVGEQEARNTQARLNMTAAQRDAEAPYLAQEGLSVTNEANLYNEFLKKHEEYGKGLASIFHPGYDKVRKERGWSGNLLLEKETDQSGVQTDLSEDVSSPAPGLAEQTSAEPADQRNTVGASEETSDRIGVQRPGREVNTNAEASAVAGASSMPEIAPDAAVERYEQATPVQKRAMTRSDLAYMERNPNSYRDSSSGEDVRYSISPDAQDNFHPLRDENGEIKYVYKAFYARDGKLYPPMVSNISDVKNAVRKPVSRTMRGLDTPVGIVLTADVGKLGRGAEGELIRNSRGRLVVVNDKGGGTLAFRPGWHLGEWPDAKQFNKNSPLGQRTVMPDALVFAKCEIAGDVDYQLQAMSLGVKENGKYDRTQAGLPRIPTNGYYKYRTNPDPQTAPWYITGAMRIVEILDDADCAEICAQYGVTPSPRESGKPIRLEDYGLKRGPVTAVEDITPYAKNEAAMTNEQELRLALNDPAYADAYVGRTINFDDQEIIAEFKRNRQDIDRYRALAEGGDYTNWRGEDERYNYSISPEANDWLNDLFEEDDGLGAADAGSVNTTYDNLQAESKDFYPSGPAAVRHTDVPTKDFEGRNIPKSASTVYGAAATTENGAKQLESMIANGELSFDTITDKNAVNKAKIAMRGKGFDGALEQYRNACNNGVASKDNTALGQRLLTQAMADGNEAAVAELLLLYTRNSTTVAQALQAQSMYRKLSPEGQLVGLQKAIEAFNEKYGTDVQMTEQEIHDYTHAESDEAREKVREDVVKRVAKELPRTGWESFKAKFDAIRYLAMLGNPRTHFRNIIGNAMFQPLVAAKNRIGAIGEGIAKGLGADIERTKSLTGINNPVLFKEAAADFEKVKDHLNEVNRGSEVKSGLSEIEREAKAFSDKNAFGRAMNKASDFNSGRLEAEDAAFKQIIYIQSLAGYLQANGVKSIAEAEKTIEGRKLLANARNYAAQEAMRNTFNDRNMFSDAVAGLGKLSRSKNPVSKAAGYVVEGVVPFKRTPTNILVRAGEYSPIGAANGIYNIVKGAKAGDSATLTKGIDRLAAGLTGTGLLALGFALAGAGMIRGGDDDDDKQKNFDKLRGHQNYSVETADGTSVTLDWLAPEAIPFFMGVELFNGALNGQVSYEDIRNMFKNATSPMLEMSMLQGLNDMFENAGYAKNNDESVLGSVLTSALTSYLTQPFPTWLGQGERAFGEDQRMSTYTDKNSEIPTDLQYTLGKLSQKIPGWDYNQIPYIDQWGRTQSTGGLGERVANNMLNPAYVSRISNDPVEDELQRLYDVTGESVFPQKADRSIKVDGETRYLTADEYVAYATRKGQLSYELVSSLVNDPGYRNLSDSEKAKALSDLYSYANAKAKEELFGVTNDSQKKMNEAVAAGISPSDYVSYQAQIDSLEPTQGRQTVVNLQKYHAIAETDMSEKNKVAAIDIIMKPTAEKQNEKMHQILDSGVSLDHYLTLMDVQERINKNDVSADYKATLFADWVNKVSWLNDDQKNLVKQDITFSSGAIGTANDRALKAQDVGLTIDQYYDITAQANNVASIKNEKGNSVSNSSGLRKMQIIYSIPNLTDEQRRYLFEASGVGKTVIDYSKEKVDSELAKMEAKYAKYNQPASEEPTRGGGRATLEEIAEESFPKFGRERNVTGVGKPITKGEALNNTDWDMTAGSAAEIEAYEKLEERSRTIGRRIYDLANDRRDELLAYQYEAKQGVGATKEQAERLKRIAELDEEMDRLEAELQQIDAALEKKNARPTG